MHQSTPQTESSRLLRQPITGESSCAREHGVQLRAINACQRFCLPSNSGILILLWTAAVGVVYYYVLIMAVILIDTKPLSPMISISVSDFLPYTILAVIAMLYPFSGVIADVYCGRLKTVQISLIFILIFTSLMCLIEVIVYTTPLQLATYYNYSVFFLKPEGIVVCIIIGISLISFAIGLAGYQVNFIQLGLDELFEASTQYLSLFILYAAWAFHLGSLPLTTIQPLLLCNVSGVLFVRGMLSALPFITSAGLIILLLLSRWKHQWFNTDQVQQNPYKTVFKVLIFAKKHKHPLQRSAFTFSDNCVPSRIDFAKERYGGPFTTEQVENVKTFLRIVVVLLAVGPLFTLEAPASYFFFPLFGMHTLQYHKHLYKDTCMGETVIVGSGNLMNILSSLILFPMYIWITFTLVSKKIQKLFSRLIVGALFCLLGVTSLLTIDVVGHSLKQHSDPSNETLSQCMFQFYRTNSTFTYPTLNLHWSVLIAPSIFLGVGPLMVLSATLEFISAQSPQPMKGFLIGIFFAIRGLFQFINSLMTIPFSLKYIWVGGMKFAVTSCGFAYFLLTLVFGIIGLVLVSLAAKKYRYRKRDEGMFRQQDVEDIYERYIISQTSIGNMSSSSS